MHTQRKNAFDEFENYPKLTRIVVINKVPITPGCACRQPVGPSGGDGLTGVSTPRSVPAHEQNF